MAEPATQDYEDDNEDLEAALAEDDELDYEVVDDTPEEDRDRPAPAKGSLDENVDNDEEIRNYSKRAQDRIKQLSWQRHEERRQRERIERENQAAVDYARKVYEENRKLREELSSGEDRLIVTSKSAAEAKLLAAKQAFKEAYENGDADKISEAQASIAEAQIELRQANDYKPRYNRAAVRDASAGGGEHGNVSGEELSPQRHQAQRQDDSAQSKPDPLAQEWLSNNSWFGRDREMTGYAQVLHEKLVLEDNVHPQTRKYWDQIDAGLRKRFPDKFSDGDETPAPARSGRPSVASATRDSGKSGGKKKVTLTQSEINLAKKLGISPEAYAKEKLKLQG